MNRKWILTFIVFSASYCNDLNFKSQIMYVKEGQTASFYFDPTLRESKIEDLNERTGVAVTEQLLRFDFKTFKILKLYKIQHGMAEGYTLSDYFTFEVPILKRELNGSNSESFLGQWGSFFEFENTVSFDEIEGLNFKKENGKINLCYFGLDQNCYEDITIKCKQHECEIRQNQNDTLGKFKILNNRVIEVTQFERYSSKKYGENFHFQDGSEVIRTPNKFLLNFQD
ncbi:hypothetical protein BUQ74_01555 [Leptospira weilii serovar Heyan]|uniref:hypothetical protein n=1 Tax=Leptospira weilii TaxID=28184 RepID=UPI0007746B09|nr:hypothetical protein [Leptospira weilii]OMI18908.1 hypothetical protein BUQ74_01555 [Leptospira weilii serovar Heyan]